MQDANYGMEQSIREILQVREVNSLKADVRGTRMENGRAPREQHYHFSSIPASVLVSGLYQHKTIMLKSCCHISVLAPVGLGNP